MTAPVRRSSLPQAVGENRRRIRILEALPNTKTRAFAYIIRDGTAPPLTVPSNPVLNGTTVFVDGFNIEFQNYGMDVDLAQGEITVPVDGVYLLAPFAVWTQTGFAVAVSFALNDFGHSGTNAPTDTRTLLTGGAFTYQQGPFMYTLNGGDVLGMSVGQNSGSDKTITQTSFQVALVQEF